MSLFFPRESQARTRRDRWLAVLFALLSVVLVVRAARKEHGVLARNQEWGARFLDRQDPYFDSIHGKREHGPYPPSFAWVAAPLSRIPTTAARISWAALQCAGLALFLRLLRRRTEELWPALVPHVPMISALALVLVSRYLLRDTMGGGGNLLFTLLAFSGVELALRENSGLGGVPLALSLVLKPNLAPLLVFLAVRRRWRAVLVALGTGALLFALPGLYYGPAAYARLSLRWASDVASFVQLEDLHSSSLVPDGLPPAEDGMNQSLREAVHRALRPPGDSGARDVHVLEASPETASWIARVAGAALFLAACAAAWKASDARSEWLAGLAFYPLALLCSPVTWKAHHVDLLPVLYGILCCALEPGRRSRALQGVLLTYWVVCDLLSREVVGDRTRDWLQALSVVTWADVLWMVILLWLARRPGSRT